MPSPLISIGQLIDQSWALYRAKFNELMSISGWLLLLAILFVISLSLYPSASNLWFSNELTWSENIGILLFILTQFIIAPLLGLWVLIGLSRLGRSFISGKSITVQTAVAQIHANYFPTLLVSVMVALLLFVATLIGFGPSIVLAAIGAIAKSSILITLANLLLLVGVLVSLILAFKWTVEYILAPYAAMLDNARGKQALAQSRQLIRGRFWETLLRLVIPKMVFIFISIILMAIVAYVANILLSTAGGLNLDLRLRLATMVEWVIPVVIATLINPLIILADVLLYRSLKGDR